MSTRMPAASPYSKGENRIGDRRWSSCPDWRFVKPNVRATGFERAEGIR